MQDRRIEELIEELHALRLKETAIIAQIEQETAKERTQSGGSARTTPPSSRGAHSATFKRGDRVRIVNKIRKPATAGAGWVREKEETATVTRIREGQIHITTDNGTQTWRGPNNLQLI